MRVKITIEMDKDGKFVPVSKKVEEMNPKELILYAAAMCASITMKSILDKENIVPFRAVSGLPNRFVAPYWSGSWYVNYVDGAWGASYARIDGGTIIVERGADGSHRFICNLQDCTSPTFTITTDTTISSDKIIIY